MSSCIILICSITVSRPKLKNVTICGFKYSNKWAGLCSKEGSIQPNNSSYLWCFYRTQYNWYFFLNQAIICLQRTSWLIKVSLRSKESWTIPFKLVSHMLSNTSYYNSSNITKNKKNNVLNFICSWVECSSLICFLLLNLYVTAR